MKAGDETVMKKIIIILTLVFSCLIATESNSLAKEQLEPLSIALINNNIPFSFALPDGRPAGLYVEFWQLWSATNDIPIALKILDFEDSVQSIKDEKVDVHSGLFVTPDRLKWAGFSLPIHRVITGVLYNDNYDKSTKLSDMVGKKIAAQAGSYQASYVEKNYPEVELVLYRDNTEILYQLLDNKVQGIVSEIPYLEAQVAKLGLRGVFNIAEEQLDSNEIHAMVPKGRTDLIKILNQGIKNIPLRKLMVLEKKWLPNLKPFFRDKAVFSALSLKEQQWLNSNPIITLGIETAWPPFEFTDEDGNYNGITADYIHYMREKLDIDMEPVTGISWSEALEELKAGKIDLIPGIAKTAERSKSMNFTEPFFSFPTVIVTQKDSFYAGNMKALNNKRLGIVKGYVFAELISKDFPEIILQTYGSVNEGLKHLRADEIDAFIDAHAVINFELNNMKAQDLHIAFFSPYTFELSMAVRKGMEPLVGILNKTFASMTNKQRAAIANTWLRINIQRGLDLTIILIWAIPISSLVLLVILIIVRTNQRMKSEIIERKKIEVSLDLARETAEAASKAKSDFLANMSHEIRTPMNAVIGMAHLLEESGLSKKQQKYLDTINTSSASLLLLINDILDLSKIAAGKLDLEEKPFPLKQVVKNISAQILLHIDHEMVTYKEEFESSLPKVLLGDALRLGQVLLNIANNAMKFTKQGEIKLSISVLEQGDNTIKMLFTVADTGIGMTKEQLKRLFQTYSQADTSTTRKYGGTGLGLTICKNICELMGGDIWVDSKIDQGSVFYFTAVFSCLTDDDPRLINFQNKEKKKVSVKDVSIKDEDNYPKLVGKHVLIVDDNQVNLIIAKKILKNQGMIVTTAQNGEECLKVLDKESFAAVLMDIQMPVMDGYTATLRIRENVQYKELPVIALSANVMKEFVDRSIEVGMSTHLSKPLDVEKLLNTLDQYIS